MSKMEVDSGTPVPFKPIHHPKAAIRDEVNSTMVLTLSAVETKEYTLLTRVMRHANSIRRKQTAASLSWAVHKYHPAMAVHLAGYTDKIAAEDAEDLVKGNEAADAALVKEIAAANKKAEEEAKQAKDAELAAKGKGSEVAKKTEEARKELKEKEAKEAEKKAVKTAEEAKRQVEAAKVPEVHALVHLLTCMFLIDEKQNEQAAEVAKSLLESVQAQNRRSMDILSAKVYYFFCLTQEHLGNLDSIRPTLLQYHRTATLQHNEPGQSALVVCILRSFLHYKLYEQADKFRLNTTLPENRANDVHARYLYYLGQINAVQLQYSDAFSNLTQAVRKAPQTSALGFRQTATKLLVIVQLLMGEIPERAIFMVDHMRGALQPYLELTKAVRVGDLAKFEEAVTTHKAVWERDGMTSLISRLRNNVIKTGLRKLNTSYSRIPLADVCSKLNLDSVEDAEFIVSKCIHDGVVDAGIDAEGNFMFSKERDDKYATHAPQALFHKRVMFCMEIHNDAVKALRFPNDDSTKEANTESLLEDDDVQLEADSMEDE